MVFVIKHNNPWIVSLTRTMQQISNKRLLANLQIVGAVVLGIVVQ